MTTGPGKLLFADLGSHAHVPFHIPNNVQLRLRVRRKMAVLRIQAARLSNVR
ncbi:hypothetical protein OZX72_03850 [Bifidobacterium sp. ESL0769]|uniref:hypothetical protein n=1 Tax=Bifidobacterium sp. ESL0769 TaxID=2983229 RepID=UPI0023F98017|nr:hypothetical protein [Bifidobacterium sp. ESL0769]WEV68119.1 hypothetical protein OZX72_03850 [Bifidobacterium sp. ESL0769]